MSALSKQFLKISANQTCASLLHPNETCTHQFFDLLWRNIFGIGKFYLPTFMISLMLKIKSLNREMCIQAMIDYAKCILIANWLSTITMAGNCGFSKIFGFSYPWFIWIPTVVGTLFFNYFPDKMKRWQATGLLNLYFETMIKKSNSRIIEYLRKSYIFATLMFMGFSAAVMTGFKITGAKRFWFTSMPDSIKDENKTTQMLKNCVHDGTCRHYIWKEFFKSFKLAMILGFLKFVVSKYRRIKLAQPTAAIKLLLQQLDYNMMSFTISYNTLFKLLHCWFNNKMGGNTVKNVMAAGFFSGITYSLYPIYMIFTYGMATTMQMGWLIFSKYITNRTQNTKRSKITNISGHLINFVNKLPILTIIITFCIIQLFQYRLQYPYATPLYVHKFMSQASSKRVDRIALLVSEVMLGIK